MEGSRDQPDHHVRCRGARAAALSVALTLAAATASGLAAAPAWAAGGYHLTYIGVGRGPQGVALSPDGARAYVANRLSGSVSVIDTAANHALTSTSPTT